MKTNTNTWLKICCANFWAMALCVSFRMPKRFACFRFISTPLFFFFLLFPMRHLLATCEQKRGRTRVCAREMERYGLFMKNT